MTMHVTTDKVHAAVLDEAHIGHIRGALGTILPHDTGPRQLMTQSSANRSPGGIPCYQGK